MRRQLTRVEGYSGRKADERPLRFYLGETCFEVEEILDRWYDPDGDAFKIRCPEGVFLLRHGPGDVWTLETIKPDAP